MQCCLELFHDWVGYAMQMTEMPESRGLKSVAEISQMTEPTSLLHRPLYRMREVDHLLGTPKGTARCWIDGCRRGRHSQAPLVRAERTGSDRVTWGEFVEARMIAEYRHRGSAVFGLRPAIVALREAFDSSHPLAIADPFRDAEGRKAVLGVQHDVDLDPGLRLVVPNGRDVALAPEVVRFADVASFGADGVVKRIVLQGAIVADPEYSSGRPTIAGRRLRADVIAEAVAAGECRSAVARMWDVAPATVDDAVRFLSVA